MKRILLMAMLIGLFMPGPGWAQYNGSLGVFGDAGATTGWEDPGTGFAQFYIVLVNNPGAKAVQFSLPFPECFNWTYVGESSNYTTIGDSRYGLAVAFGVCLSSPVHVLTVTAMGSGWTGDECCQVRVMPDPAVAEGEVIYTDCTEPVPVIGYLRGGATTVSGYFPPKLTGHSPATGSTEQPLDVDISWSYDLCRGDELCAWWNHVYFGLDPDPPVAIQWHGYDTYDPGPLLPGTTYYWKVTVVDPCAGETTSPVYSFTTEDNVPGEKASWGKIKALYQ